MSSTIDLAVIALPPESTRSRSSEDTEELFHCGGLWVINAPELKLHVCITAGSEVTDCASAFSSKLGQVLCNSKLWVDLGLACLFKSCDHVVGPNQSTIFQLSFGLRRRTKHSTISKSLRLPAAMRCYNDAIPPIDIPTAYLATINISLEYNYCSGSRQPYISCDLMTPKLLEPLQYSIDKDENLEDDILDESMCLYVNPLPQPSKMATFKNGVSIFVEELEELNEEWHNPSEKHLNKETVKWESNGVPSNQDFHTLFDTGFRTLIFQNPFPADRRTKRSKKERLQCLSEIAPAVFSRGYREAMDQRSQFIPSIAKSLTSILDRTNNPNLLPKISALKSLNHLRSEGTLPTSNAIDLRNAIKSSLWRIAQKQLYNPKASRNLSPLKTAPIQDEEHSTLEGSLLTVSITDKADYAWDRDEDDTLNYGSDYLDPQEDFDIWEAEDENDTPISLAEDLSIGMLDGNDTDDPIETQDTTLCTSEDADQIISHLSPIPFEDDPLCQSGLSDCEMLASDPFDEAMSSSNFCLTGIDLMDDVAGFDEDLDDMLCG